MNKGLPMMYVNVIENMYEQAITRIRSLCGKMWIFVRVEEYLSSALSPLFIFFGNGWNTKDVQSKVSQLI